MTGSLGGYAYFPSTTTVGQPFDGIVGILPTTHSDETVAEILVHELWHYLHIYHPWGPCGGDGDFCADTPPTDSPSGCNLSTIKCGNLVMVQNVMDYAHCGTGGTYDQSARATATLIGLRNQLWNSGTCSGTPGNIPPTCSITFPANNQNFAVGNITINVSAADQNGSITKVEFYTGSTLLSTDLASPYTFVWQNVTQGSYQLTARATDNAGATTTSSVINITVGTSSAPACNLTSPVNGANYIFQVQNVKLEAAASDADGIASVDFAINNIWTGLNLKTPPYIVFWQPNAIGTFTIKAKATDNTGAVTISNIATITVTSQTNPPPVVSITSPANNSTYTAPASITIAATATDNTSISKVDFFAGTTLWNSDNSFPYSFTRTNVPAGSYVITARAYDSQNASTVSSPVSITVTAGATDSPVNVIILKANGDLKFDAQDGRTRTIPK